MTVSQLPRLLTISQCAAATSMSERWLRKRIASGEIVARRVGGAMRVLSDDLDEWMRSTPKVGSPDVASAGVSPTPATALATSEAPEGHTTKQGRDDGSSRKESPSSLRQRKDVTK